MITVTGQQRATVARHRGTLASTFIFAHQDDLFPQTQSSPKMAGLLSASFSPVYFRRYQLISPLFRLTLCYMFISTKALQVAV
jgi:hypothetical protein